MKSKWEIVHQNSELEITARLKVHGGWLVKTTTGATVRNNFGILNANISTSICFMPDPNHEWK